MGSSKKENWFVERKKEAKEAMKAQKLAIGESSITLAPEQIIIEGKTIKISSASGKPVSA